MAAMLPTITERHRRWSTKFLGRVVLSPDHQFRSMAVQHGQQLVVVYVSGTAPKVNLPEEPEVGH
jgi:hypothetical protein